MTPVTALFFAAFLTLLPISAHAETMPLWPGSPPGGEKATAKEEVVERRKSEADLRDRITKGVRRPTLTVFRAAKPTGAAILMAPGGGYSWVVMDKEGYEAAELFARRGVTVFVMTYRLPQEGWAAGADTPLQDAQRALRLVRARASEFGVDPRRIGVMGFSAGGHVAGSLTFGFDKPVYAAVDAADRVSARPDFSMLMYPVATMSEPAVHKGSRKNLLGEQPSPERIAAYSLETQVRGDAPPTFLLHAADDESVPVENSLKVFAALKAKKVPTELHVFEEGGHGFGLRFAVGKPVASWPDLVLAWMDRKGFLTERP